MLCPKLNSLFLGFGRPSPLSVFTFLGIQGVFVPAVHFLLFAVQAVDALERRVHLLEQQHRDTRQGKHLRVITGRGLHSTDGEAALPRAISSFLEDQKGPRGWKVAHRLGAIGRQGGRQLEPVRSLQPGAIAFRGVDRIS